VRRRSACRSSVAELGARLQPVGAVSRVLVCTDALMTVMCVTVSAGTGTELTGGKLH
jgi:hypothetical protein